MPAASRSFLARRTCGLPAMPTTRTGFDDAAAATLWTMSALKLATVSRIAGCKRASSRTVRGMGAGRMRRARTLPPHRAASRRRGPSSRERARERAALVVLHRALQLRGRVHHERPVLRDRLAERLAGDEEHP